MSLLSSAKIWMGPISIRSIKLLHFRTFRKTILIDALHLDGKNKRHLVIWRNIRWVLYLILREYIGDLYDFIQRTLTASRYLEFLKTFLSAELSISHLKRLVSAVKIQFQIHFIAKFSEAQRIKIPIICSEPGYYMWYSGPGVSHSVETRVNNIALYSCPIWHQF